MVQPPQDFWGWQCSETERRSAKGRHNCAFRPAGSGRHATKLSSCLTHALQRMATWENTQADCRSTLRRVISTLMASSARLRSCCLHLQLHQGNQPISHTRVSLVHGANDRKPTYNNKTTDGTPDTRTCASASYSALLTATCALQERSKCCDRGERRQAARHLVVVRADLARQPAPRRGAAAMSGQVCAHHPD